MILLPAERCPSPGGAQAEQRAKVADGLHAEHPSELLIHLPSVSPKSL